MEDFVYGIRQWKKQGAQTLLLIFGFTIFSTLLALVTATAPNLFEDTPDWVKSNERFVTIGLRTHEDTIRETSIKNLNSIANDPAISEVTFIGSMLGNYRISDNTVKSSISFVDDNFSRLLKIPELESDGVRFQHLAYVSAEFQQRWKFENGQELIGQTILLGDIETPVQVAGLIPKRLQEQRGLQVGDILVSAKHAEALQIVSFGDIELPLSVQQNFRKEITIKAPNIYGIATLRKGYHKSDLVNLNSAMDKGDGNITIVAGVDNLEPYIYEGIEFLPNAKDSLIKQWFAIFALCLVFGILNTLNLITLSFNQFLKRSSEFSTRIAIGASARHLFYQLSIEYLPLLLGGLLSCWFFTFFAIGYLKNSYYWLVDIKTFPIFLGVALSSFMMCVTIMISAYLPLVKVLKKQQFNRSKNSDLGPLQVVLGKINMAIQVVFAGIALVFAISMLIAQLYVKQQQNFQANVFASHLSSSNDSDINMKRWMTDLERAPSNVALSSSSFTKPWTDVSFAALNKPIFENAPSLNLLSVSRDYFSVINGRFLAGSFFEQNGIVINQAAAEMLGFSNAQYAIGQSLFVAEANRIGLTEKSSLPIQGVVENLPHYGILNKDTPILYADISLRNDLEELYLFTKNGQQIMLEDWIKNKAEFSVGLWQYHLDGPISDQLNALNSDMNQMVALAIIIGTTICLLSTSCLYYQLSSLFQLNERKLGIKLAIGARLHHLFTDIAKDLIGIVMIAMLMVSILALVNSTWVKQQLGAEIDSPTVLLLTMLVLIIITLFSGGLAFSRSVDRPIRELL